ncbi:SURF1 family protein [Croceibacterium ferulae]|uniref:SURF1 family protein n=1 Tax=Croceibacterium ferulae TaxID=1854641 RepID=UPI000EAB89FD|nr:SURF1 family protein [Croceibacterium ferulae]
MPSARRRVPLLPTIVVAAAVALMLVLGVWQLRRAEWKGDMIARYADAETLPPVAWPDDGAAREAALYRPSSFTCAVVLGMRETAGRSAKGQSGWAHVAKCRLAEGGEAEVALGWSAAPTPPVWDGGRVTGTVAPAGEGARLVADPPQAGLEVLARPDPKALPNNHLSYAGQWFFFAITAAVIYAMALRRRAGPTDLASPATGR